MAKTIDAKIKFEGETLETVTGLEPSDDEPGRYRLPFSVARRRLRDLGGDGKADFVIVIDVNDT